jgi:hypothetical protein
VELNGKLGFIDDKGQEVASPIYDAIGYFGVFDRNIAEVTLNGKKTFINREGQLIAQ